MNCKFCNAEMDENFKFCPQCGKDQVEEPVSIETAEAATDVQTVTPEPKTEPKKNRWPMILGITGAVMGLLALAITLMLALGVDFKAMFSSEPETQPTESTAATETVSPRESEHVKNADVVVATMGDKTLTNAQLYIYYRMQVMDVLNYYGSYLDQLGLDITMPLNEQTCYYDETKTWEQFLMEEAIKTWQHYQALGLLAEENGFQLEGEWKESLEQLKTQLEEQATTGGYESVDAMLIEAVGPTCTLEEYMKYVNLAYLSGAYYEKLQMELDPTATEVEEYFKENETAFANNGITMTSGNIATVRHILLTPENGILNEETQETTYMEEDLKKCLAEAEDLLEQWKKGEATEESFAALVPEHSDDGGSLQTGGLYENVGPTSSFVEPFRTWAVDVVRQPGDTGIVLTQFGYHIMYYVSGEPQWQVTAKSELINKLMNDKTEAAEAKWPAEIDYEKVCLMDLKLGV